MGVAVKGAADARHGSRNAARVERHQLGGAAHLGEEVELVVEHDKAAVLARGVVNARDRGRAKELVQLVEVAVGREIQIVVEPDEAVLQAGAGKRLAVVMRYERVSALHEIQRVAAAVLRVEGDKEETAGGVVLVEVGRMEKGVVDRVTVNVGQRDGRRAAGVELEDLIGRYEGVEDEFVVGDDEAAILADEARSERIDIDRRVAAGIEAKQAGVAVDRVGGEIKAAVEYSEAVV